MMLTTQAWAQTNEAKIGDQEYATLTEAITAATGEQPVVLLKNVTLSSTVSINKGITIDGDNHTVTKTSAGVAFELTGSNNVTFTNLSINATNASGRAIQAGNDTEKYSGNLTVSNSTLTAGQRGVSIYEPGGNINLAISNTTIQSTVSYPTTEYNPNDSRGVALWSYDNHVNTVTLDDVIIKGFSYCINVGGTGKISNLTMNGGSTYGRAIINNHGKNSTFNLIGVDIHGLNNQTGPTEAYACIVDDSDCENNTYNVNGCTFTATLSDAAIAGGGNASEYLVSLRGQNSNIYITNGTTYTTNNEERGGLIENYGQLDVNKGNTINFDAATYSTFDTMCDFANVPGLNTDGNSLSYTSEVYYYWSEGSGYKGSYCSFAQPFEEGWLDNGEFIKLQRDVTLTSDITWQKGDGNSFYLELNGHSLIQDANVLPAPHINLKEGVTVYTDVEIDGILFGMDDCPIVKSANTDATYKYKYTVVAEDNVAHINGSLYTSLAAAVEAAQDGDVITMIASDYTSLTSGGEIEITKSITITGPVDSDGMPLCIINGTDDNSGYNDLFIKCTTGTVTISNVAIDGFGNTIASKIGHAPITVSTQNNKVVLDNVWMSNINCEGIHINGGEFEITNCYIDASKDTGYSDFTKGICVANAATGSITGTTIDGVVCEMTNSITAGIELQGQGPVTIDGCTITASGNGAAGIAANSAEDLQPGASTATVSNSTVTSDYLSLYGDGEKGALISVTSGTYNGPLLAVAGTNSQGLSISGGTFNNAVPAAYCALGYAPVDNGDGTYTVEVHVVAKIGSTEYATLEAAVAAATDGQTIELLDNCSGSGLFIGPNKFTTGLTIDFKNFTYTVNTPVGSPGTVNQALHFEQGNNITLTNGGINMTTDATALGAFEMFMQNYGALTIDNMTIDGTGIPVATYASSYGTPWGGTAKPQFNYNTAGSSVVRNSTITMPGDLSIDDAAALTIEDDAVINVNKIATKGTDDRFDSATGSVTVENGAKFKLVDADGVTAFEALLNANGQTLGTPNEQGVYTVVMDAVAEINTVGYLTLKEAFEAVQDGETIKLIKDVNLNSGGTGSSDNNNFTCPLTSGTITIDYNGKNISASNRFINLHNGVTVVTNKTYVNGDERPLFFRAADADGVVVASLVSNAYKFTTLQTSEVAYIDENEADQTAEKVVPLTAGLGEVIFLDTQWYYPTADVTFDKLLFVRNETATIILKDGATMTVTTSAQGNNNAKGNLVIYGQSGKTGALTLPRGGNINMSMLSYTQNGGNVISAGAYDARAITINNGTLDINSNGGSYSALGRIPAASDFASSTLTIKKGIVNTTATGTNGNAIQTGTVDITGGQVTATGRNAGIKATTINIGLTENADLSPSEEFILVSKYDGTVNIYGTDNTLYDAETNVAYQGQPVTDNTTIDGRKLVVGLTVAVIGDMRFKTLKAAIDYITNDGAPRTIQLVNDIADQEALEIAESNKSITIDMNGHTITAKENQPFNVTGDNVNLTFTGTGEIVNATNGYQGVSMRGENGHLTIGAGVTLTEATVFVRGKNNTVDINGKINVTGDQAAIQTNGDDTNTGNVINVNDPAVITSEDNAIYAAGDANYNINGGSVTGATAIYVKSGKLTVTDGTIAATGAQAPYTANNNGADATGDGIVVDNCNYPNGSPEVIIRGGTVTSENADPVASYARDGQPKVTGFIYAGLYNKEFDASLLAQGYVLQSNGSGMFTPVPGAGVAKIGDVYYQTLDAAIADVPTDGTPTTIELLTNINAEKRALIPSNTNITLDLGGYTLRCDDDFTIAFFDGAVGAVGSNKTENAQLTVKNGTVTSKKSYAIRTDGDGNTLTIAEDATVKAGNETDYAIVVRGKNTTVTVNGTVEVLKGTAISTNGNDATNNNSITINEPAKITSPDDNAIYLPSGSLTVNGGTITGTTGIYFKSKNLTIPATSTAVITGTGEQRAAHYNGNGGNWTGDALVVDNANYPAGDPLANIQGGTFVSANALPIASYATGSSATAATKFVSGGKFSAQIPADVIVDGYICPSEPNEGSYYTLIPGSYVAEVEGLGYETFEKAVAAADGEKVITLLADITPDYTMSEGQTLKVAKEGHNITVVAPAGFQVSETTETIDGKVVTIYTLPKNIVPLVPDNLRSDWTGDEQSVPLVIKDGNYTLVKGTDYKLQKKDDSTGSYVDTDDITKTDVGPVTFNVVGLGKYIGEKEVTWTIIKNINNDPIHIEIDPAVYTTENIDPKDYIHVYDGTGANRTELEYGADKDYTITVTTTIQDAKTYVNAITVTGTEKDPKYIGGEATFSMSVQPGDIRDMTVDGNVQPWREAGYTVAQIADLITVTDNAGNVLTKGTDYTITVADGTYKDAKTYEKIITITAKEGGNYTGIMKVDFTIMPEGLIDISKCVVTSKTVYTSQSQSPNYSNIEVVYKNGYNRVVLDSKQFDIQLNGMMSGYIDAKTYSNAITLVGTTKAGDSNTLRFYGSVNADYVIAPRDLADTNFDDDEVEVVLEKNKDMVWDGTDLTDKIMIGDIAGANNLYLYMKVKNAGYRYPLTVDDAQNKYDYTYTVIPSPMIDPGEYKVLFTGRGNFTGMREVKINVLKDISLIDDSNIEIPVQILGSATQEILPSNIQDMVVRDGSNVLKPGVHYTLTFKDYQGTDITSITQQGKYTAVMTGKEPYYSGVKTKDFIVVNEYYAYNATETGEKYGVHITSGKDLTATVGAKTGAAIDVASTSMTVKSAVVVDVQVPNQQVTVTFTINGIDNGAFSGANNLHWLDITALEGYTPATLDRSTDRGPFAKVPKQTLVFLDGTTATGENYIYKFTATDFRCDVLKIYDDISGVQTSFTEQDGYKWGFENPYEFKANTVTNTRQLNSGNGYTIYLPYALPTPTGIDAYTLTASKDNLLGFLPVAASTLEALTPYVLLANASGQLLSTTNATVKKTTDADPEDTKVTSSAVSGQNTYTMYGNLKYNDDSSITGAYIMQGGNVWKPILNPGSEGQGACILPMRAYIVVGSGSLPAPALQSVFGMPGATDMDIFDHVGIDVEDGQYYDLQGRPVETPTRGVYVRNGKKVVIK